MVKSKTLDAIMVMGISDYIREIGDARIFGKSASGNDLQIAIEDYDEEGYVLRGNLTEYEGLAGTVREIPRQTWDVLEDAVDEAIKIFGDHDIPIETIDNQPEFI